ncbi:50S ribosomal protein L1 [bacterium]|jgi:large subunit ribosomal protein L1|nr:50S ribosomal protein L1 [bacterium]
MIRRSKSYKSAREKVNRAELSALDGAIEKIKELAFVKFDESLDIDINLGIDPSKGDQVVRGSVMLPHGTGKKVRVLVFAKGDHAEQASSAGADYVGAEDLIEKITSGWMDFEYAVATPDLMGIVGKVARILGPRGLLPNKKNGTVTFDVDKIVPELKKGCVFFKNDKGGLVHLSVGKISFDKAQLVENVTAFFKSLVASRPPAAKGKFVKKMTLSSTMGIGVPINHEEIL